jgi:CheY-like chemotaxis protein
MTTAAWTGKRALVVEDNALVSIMMQDMLEELGCAISGIAGALDEAIGMAADLDCDFAILDLNIDGEVSYPVADALAARGIPFIFATGYSSSKLPDRFASACRIGKPFVMAELERAMGETLLRPAQPGNNIPEARQ